MIKRYSSPCAKFTINVKVNGSQMPIVFDRYNNDDKRRYIDIKSPDIQRQMEASKDFNVYFRLDFSTPDPDEVIEKPIAEEVTPTETIEVVEELKPIVKKVTNKVNKKKLKK